MAIATHRDLVKTREQLRTWLAGRLPEATHVSIGEVSTPPGAGFSNETLFADAAWSEGGVSSECRMVIRVEPSTHTLYFQAQQRFRQQVEVLRALGERTSVPVARVRFVEDDPGVLGSAFYVMDRIDGATVPDQPPYNVQGWLHAAAPERQAAVWWSTIDKLAELHRLDWRSLGLESLLEPARGHTGTPQQLSYWDEAYAWAADGGRYPVIEQTGAWLRGTLPGAEPLALCWGDARLANVLYTEFSPAAIIDWDLVSIGNPLQDLGWWLLTDQVQFGDRHTGDPDDPQGLPGFPSAAETLERWSALSGFPSENLDYYIALSGYKFAVCAIRYVALMNAAGFPPEAAQYADAMRLGAENVLQHIISADGK